MKGYLKELLSFSRKGRNGILVLCGILCLLILSRPLIAWLAPTPRASIPKEEVTRFLIETAKPEGSGEDASAKIRTRQWAATDHHQGNTWEPAGRKVREDRSGAKMPETNWKRGKSRQKSWSGDSCSTVEINRSEERRLGKECGSTGR